MDFSSKICPHRTLPLILPRYNTKTIFKMNKIIVYGRVSQSVLQEGRKFLEKSHSYSDIDLKTCKPNSNQKGNRLPRYSVEPNLSSIQTDITALTSAKQQHHPS